MRAGSERPIYLDFQPAGSGDDVDLVDFRSLVDRGYAGFADASDSDDVDNFVLTSFGPLSESGFVELQSDDELPLVEDVSVSLDLFQDEGLEIDDGTFIELLVSADDGFDLYDEPAEPETDPKTVFGLSHLDWGDDAQFDITIVADDGFDLYDDPEDPNVNPFADDGFDFYDESEIDLTTLADDSWGSADYCSLDLEFHADDSFDNSDQAQYRKQWNANFGVTIESVRSHDASYSSEVAVLKYDPSPINDLLNPSNPSNATVVINGETIVSHPDTIKPGAFNYVSIDPNTFIAGCDLLELDLYHTVGPGGDFTVKTRSPIGVKGQIITIAGIKCLITNTREESTDQDGDFILTRGTVGDARLLNKEILLVLDMSELSGLGNLALNTPQQAASSLQWTTCSEAAQAVANAAGIFLAWLAPDAPLTELMLETGSKVGNTIESLAKRVNAELCYDGNNMWAVVDPFTGYGGWAGIPNCGLFGTRSFAVDSFLDIDSGFVSLPIKPQSTGAVSQIGNPLYAAPNPKEPMTSFNQRMNEGDVPQFVPLNGDYDKLYLQIFLPTVDSKVVQGKFVPGTMLPSGVVAVPNSTVNPEEWKEFTFDKFKDKSGKESLVINSGLFHEDLVDNQFSLNIAYTRKLDKLADSWVQQQQEAIERRRYEDQYNQERLRYFNTRTATINFKFFGTLPVPGNRVSLSYKNKSINGTVYSYRLRKTGNAPAECELVVREFMVNNLLMPRSILDYYFATGTTP